MTSTSGVTGNELRSKLIGEVGPWGQCEDYPRADWAYEATNNDTQLGYWDWVIAKHELDPTAAGDTERAATEQDVRTTINAAADEVIAAAGNPETGVTDAINLLVNMTLHRLFDNADATLDEIVTANYSDTEPITVDDVLQWIQE